MLGVNASGFLKANKFGESFDTSLRQHEESRIAEAASPRRLLTDDRLSIRTVHHVISGDQREVVHDSRVQTSRFEQ